MINDLRDFAFKVLTKVLMDASASSVLSRSRDYSFNINCSSVILISNGN